LVAESAIAPPENWRLKGLNIQLAFRNKNPQFSVVGQRCSACEICEAAMATTGSFYPNDYVERSAAAPLPKMRKPGTRAPTWETGQRSLAMRLPTLSPEPISS
jgi:hypothetical protein